MNRQNFLIGLEGAADAPVEEADSIEQHLLEAEASDAAVGAAMETGQNLMDDTMALEGLAHVAQEGAANGGMNGQALVVLSHSASLLANRWGVPVTAVGTESSDLDADATQIACEGLKDALYSVWERFVEWYRWVRKKIKENVLKLMNAGKSMRKQAAKIEKRLDKGLGELKDGKDTITGSWLTNGSFDDKFDYNKLVKFSEEIVKGSKDIPAALAKVADESVKVVKDEDATVEEGAEDALHKAFRDLGFKSKAKLKRVAPKGSQNIVGRALPNNAYYMAFEDSDGNKEVRFVPTGAKSDTTSVKPADEKEIGDMATHLDKVGEVLEDLLKSFSRLDDKERSLEKVLAQKLKDLKQAKTENREALRAAKNEAQRNLRLAQASRQAYEFGLRHAGTALYGYASASLSAYKPAE